MNPLRLAWVGRILAGLQVNQQRALRRVTCPAAEALADAAGPQLRQLEH